MDAPAYQKFLQYVPLDLACDIIHWEYVQDTGRLSEEDIRISVDLDGVYYCNGAYWGPSNMWVAAETGRDAKDCRLHFFASGDVTVGEEIIHNYGACAIRSGLAEFGL